MFNDCRLHTYVVGHYFKYPSLRTHVRMPLKLSTVLPAPSRTLHFATGRPRYGGLGRGGLQYVRVYLYTAHGPAFFSLVFHRGDSGYIMVASVYQPIRVIIFFYSTYFKIYLVVRRRQGEIRLLYVMHTHIYIVILLLLTRRQPQPVPYMCMRKTVLYIMITGYIHLYILCV